MSFKKVTLAGGGVLGSQIAYQTAYKGFDVTIWLRSPESVERAKENDVNPFTNVISARYVKGSELADALEYSVYAFPDMFGGFLQVSGITFDIDPSVESSVKVDEKQEFISIYCPRRVSNIKINGEPIDYERYYSCASNEYILKNGGNGYNMFKGDMIDMGRVITDADSLKEYLEYLGGSMPAEYSDEDGQGRMNFLTAVE